MEAVRDRVRPGGRAVRLVATLVGAALLLAGTLFGADDHFPFGPFRMFATTDQLDAPIVVLSLRGVDASGRTVELTERNTGIRRAELEGQASRFAEDPTRLSAVDRAYSARNPGAPSLVEIDIVRREHALRGGRPTGAYEDRTLVAWRP
jgi:hypothetical protein